MRHGKKTNHLGRKTAHRKAMLANMACSLIEHKRINTTVAKAKALKQFIEPLVTKSKEDTTHNRRIVFSRLRQKGAVAELFRDVAVKVGDRPGGYTRIIKLGNRLGDNADMAMIEFVDFNEIYNEYITDKAKEQSSRCSQCGIPFCQVHCPLSNNIPDWLKLTAEGRLEEAYELAQSTNIAYKVAFLKYIS